MHTHKHKHRPRFSCTCAHSHYTHICDHYAHTHMYKCKYTQMLTQVLTHSTFWRQTHFMYLSFHTPVHALTPCILRLVCCTHFSHTCCPLLHTGWPPAFQAQALNREMWSNRQLKTVLKAKLYFVEKSEPLLEEYKCLCVWKLGGEGSWWGGLPGSLWPLGSFHCKKWWKD